MARRGLTLLELTIVIGVIALLLTLSVPALMRARNEAQIAVCSQNLKTLSLAWLLYKDDNDDRLVDSYVDPAGKHAYAWAMAPTGSYSIEREKEGIRRGALFSYTGRSLDAYRCPADGGLPEPVRSQPAFRSYSIADGANGVAWQNTYSVATTYSDIQQPAGKYVFVEEADDRGWNRYSWVLNPKNQTWLDPLAVWHSKTKSTLGFADGHAEVRQWVDRSTIEMFLKQQYGWPVPANEGEDLRFMLAGFPQKSPDTPGGS